MSRVPRGCLVVAAAALLLRGLLASRSSLALDRLFVPDDTYYTLEIARSIARGLGPTVDGVHLTSGFQPLLAFLLVPVLRFGASEEVGKVSLVSPFTERIYGAVPKRGSAHAGLSSLKIRTYDDTDGFSEPLGWMV